VFFVAIGRTEQAAMPIFLVSLDPETGAVLWDRHLASCDPSEGMLMGQGRSRPGGVGLTPFGTAVTVHHGAVYLSPNLGFAACCDARDGTLVWARSYRRMTFTRRDIFAASSALLRRGSSPVVVGAGVVVAPRDSGAPVCLETERGDLRWRLSGAPPDAVVGVHGTRVVFTGRETLTGVDAMSGRAVWEYTFERPLHGRPVLAGGVVYAGTVAELFAIDATTGERLGSRAWPGFDAFLVRSDAIVGITWE
jgi:outer membrane protein assembly factor BamB